MVGCTLSLTKVPFEKKKMGYLRLKSINFDDFRHDVSASLKLLLDENTNLNDNVDHYSKSLLDALDKHAPLKNCVITLRPCFPWYTPEIDEAKKKRRKLERRWRSSHLTIDPYHSQSKQKILPVEPLIQCEAGRAKTMQRQSLYSPRTPKWPPIDKGELTTNFMSCNAML